MQIDRAIRTAFADRRWYIQALWAGLWAALGVTMPAVTGYSLDYLRNVAHGVETPLPEWNTGFGRWWVRGFLAGLAGFVYMLPAVILLAIGIFPFIAVMAASDSFGVSKTDAAALLGLLGTSALCLTTFLATVYMLAVSVFYSAAYVNYALSEEFAALFRVRDIFARLRTPGAGYFTAWGMSLVVSLVSGMAGGIVGSILGATVVLTPLAGFAGGAIGFVAALMTAHLFGQYAAAAYGLPGLPPAPPANHTPTGYTPAGYTPTAPDMSDVTAPSSTTAQAPSPSSPAPVASPPAAGPYDLPATDASASLPNPAPSAHTEPDSPLPSHSPEQAAPPSGPRSDPPAESGGD